MREPRGGVSLELLGGDAAGGQAISLLLLEVSQVLLAGGRLGVHTDFTPAERRLLGERVVAGATPQPASDDDWDLVVVDDRGPERRLPVACRQVVEDDHRVPGVPQRL